MSSGAQNAHLRPTNSQFFSNTPLNPRSDHSKTRAPSIFPAHTLESSISPPATKRQRRDGSSSTRGGISIDPPASDRATASASPSQGRSAHAAQSTTAEDVVSNASASSKASQAVKHCRLCKVPENGVYPLYKCTLCPRHWHRGCIMMPSTSVEGSGLLFVCAKCQETGRSAVLTNAPTKRKADVPEEQHEAKRPRTESTDRLRILNSRHSGKNRTLVPRGRTVVDDDKDAEKSLSEMFPNDSNFGVPELFAGRLRDHGVRSGLEELCRQAELHGQLPALWLEAPHHLLTACEDHGDLTCNAIARARSALFEAVETTIPPLPGYQPATATKPSTSLPAQIEGARIAGTPRESPALVHPLSPRPPSAAMAPQDSASGKDDQHKTKNSHRSRTEEMDPLTKAARAGALLESSGIDRLIKNTTRVATTGPAKANSSSFRSQTPIEPSQQDRPQTVSLNGKVMGGVVKDKDFLLELIPSSYRDQVQKNEKLYQAYQDLHDWGGIMGFSRPLIWARYVKPLLKHPGSCLEKSLLTQAKENMTRVWKTDHATTARARTKSTVPASTRSAVAAARTASLTVAMATSATIIETMDATPTPGTTTPTVTEPPIAQLPNSPIHGVDTPFSPVPSTSDDPRTSAEPMSPVAISKTPQQTLTGEMTTNVNGVNASRASESSQATATSLKPTARRSNLASQIRNHNEFKATLSDIKSARAHKSEEPKGRDANGVGLSRGQPREFPPSSSVQAAGLALAHSSATQPPGSIDRGTPQLKSTQPASHSTNQDAPPLVTTQQANQQQRNESATGTPYPNRSTVAASVQAEPARVFLPVGRGSPPRDSRQPSQDQQSIQQAAPTSSTSDREPSQIRKSPTAGVKRHNVPRQNGKEATDQRCDSPQARQTSPITPISQERSLSGSDQDDDPGKRSTEVSALTIGEEVDATNRKPDQVEKNVRSRTAYADRGCQTDANDVFPQEKAPEQAPTRGTSAEPTAAASQRKWNTISPEHKSRLEARGVIFEDSDGPDEEFEDDEPPPPPGSYGFPLERSKDLYEVAPSLRPLPPPETLNPNQINSSSMRKATPAQIIAWQLQKRREKFGKDHPHRVCDKPTIPEPLVTVTRMVDHTTDPQRHPLDPPEAVEMQVTMSEFMGLPEDPVYVPQPPELAKKQLVFRDAAKERKWLESGATRRARKGVDQRWICKL